MTTELSRRQVIAITGAGLLTSAAGGLANAAEAGTAPGSPATMPVAMPPGDAFARNLGPLPRDVGKMITGGAIYVDDVRFEGEAVGVVVRSPHPHARIRAIDASAARGAPGVLAVLSGEDVARMAKPIACVIPPAAYGRAEALPVDRPVLAAGRVRHVGDGVAFVVAETAEQAREAAELVKVDYESFPEYVEPRAGALGMPIWDAAPDNVAFDWQFGNPALCRDLFNRAAHTVRIHLSIPRLIPNPIEPRAAIGLGRPAIREADPGVESRRGSFCPGRPHACPGTAGRRVAGRFARSGRRGSDRRSMPIPNMRWCCSRRAWSAALSAGPRPAARPFSRTRRAGAHNRSGHGP